MQKIKTISRYFATYDRVNIYDDTIVENKHLISCVEMDKHGNNIEDKTFDAEGNIENYIKRIYNDNNVLIQEMFYSDSDSEPYEMRHFFYNENGTLISAKTKYMEDEITEKYNYSAEGNLLQKVIVYSNGFSYVEKEYEWEGNKPVKITENEENDPISVQTISYDEQGRLIRIVTIEYVENDRRTEEYEYDGDLVTKQSVFNHKGDLMTLVQNTYKNNLLIEKTIETGSQFFKHRYEYDEKGNKTKESILNHEDTVLTEHITQYNEDGLEVETKTNSLSIVDNEKELVLIEKHETVYSFFD
ncbi:MAG: hypothetical protein LBQ64_04400 [Bacteroidales bacterium]|jgi:hypothetical protein|nr:hypothetical protein [Bacteroidales bacterium]